MHSHSSVLGPRLHKTCRICGAVFDVPLSQFERRRYCSLRCRGMARRVAYVATCSGCGKAMRRVPSKKGRPFCSRACYFQSKPAPIDRTCLTCGKAFTVKPGDIRKGGGKYCCRRCWDIAPKPRKSDHSPHRSTRYRKWREAVIARDGRCRHCGATESLQAHHVEGWEVRSDLRYAIANGLTLCAPCHDAIHPDVPSGLFYRRRN